MTKVKLTVIESKCRCGYCKKGDEYIIEDLCPPLCHELWHSMYPFVYALQNGGTLDYGNSKSPQFNIKCPDEGRVIIRGERIDYEVIEVKDRLDNENIQSILATCMYMPNEEKLARTVKEYASNDNIKVFGCGKDDLICGIIVLDVSNKECAVIKAIAVEEHCRKQGIGKVMIKHLIKKALVKIIVAETDDDAVGFYRNTGFIIEDLGEKYEGITRYKCTLDCTKDIK